MIDYIQTAIDDTKELIRKHTSILDTLTELGMTSAAAFHTGKIEGLRTVLRDLESISEKFSKQENKE